MTKTQNREIPKKGEKYLRKNSNNAKTIAGVEQLVYFKESMYPEKLRVFHEIYEKVSSKEDYIREELKDFLKIKMYDLSDLVSQEDRVKLVEDFEEKFDFVIEETNKGEI